MRRQIIMPRFPAIIGFAMLILAMTSCGDGGRAPGTSAVLVEATTPPLVAPTPQVFEPAMQPTPAAMAAQPTSAPASFVDTGPQKGKAITSASQQRVVLKNATLNMTVDDPAASVTAITQMAEQMGGWVVASNATTTERDGHKLAQAAISVRVPAEQFSSALQQIKAGADAIDSENITGDDVTQKYVDLSSQLSNLQSTEAQLQKIMSTTNNINDVLTVQQRLTDVQGQIEGIQGQLKYFSEAAAYSLITLTLTQKPLLQTPMPTATITLTPTITPTPTARPLGLANWQPGQIAQTAADTVVSAGEVAISLLIWLIIVGVPIAIPVVIVLYLLRRVRPRPVARPPQVEAD